MIPEVVFRALNRKPPCDPTLRALQSLLSEISVVVVVALGGEGLPVEVVFGGRDPRVPEIHGPAVPKVSFARSCWDIIVGLVLERNFMACRRLGHFLPEVSQFQGTGTV
jgi:hypothetical protein